MPAGWFNRVHFVTKTTRKRTGKAEEAQQGPGDNTKRSPGRSPFPPLGLEDHGRARARCGGRLSEAGTKGQKSPSRDVRRSRNGSVRKKKGREMANENTDAQGT